MDDSPDTVFVLLRLVETLRAEIDAQTRAAAAAEERYAREIRRLIAMVEGLTRQIDELLRDRAEKRRVEPARVREEAKAVAAALGGGGSSSTSEPARAPRPPPGDAWAPALYARVQVRFDDGGEVFDRTLHRLWSPLSLDVPPRPVALPVHALAREPGAGDHLMLPGWLDKAAELARLRDDQVRRSAVARRWRHGDGRSRLGEDPQVFAARVGAEVSALEAEEVRAEAGDVEVVFFGVVWV
jgi:hypothetical protein